MLKELHKKGAKLKAGGYQLSTLAKLYKRRHEFTGYPTKLRFVSNVSVKVPAEDGSNVNSHDTDLGDLTPTQQTVVKESLASQLEIGLHEINLSELRLHRTDLPLGQQELFVGGKLSQLAEAGLLPFAVPQPTVAARMLASELQSKAANTNYARSFDELKKRLLTRENALSTLAKLSHAKSTLSTVFDEAIERLNHEQHDFMSIRRIKAERVRVCADAMDRTNLLFRNLARALLDACASTIDAAEPGTRLGELMNTLVINAKKMAPSEFDGQSLDYVNALTLLVINDGIDIHVFTSAVGPEPEAAQ